MLNLILAILAILAIAGSIVVLIDRRAWNRVRGFFVAVLKLDPGTSTDVDNALRRMWPLWLLFVACFAVVLFLNPMKAGLALYGIGKIALAGPVGYLISYCCTARKNRPENLEDGIALGAALKSRDLIICAAILALAFGVP